MLRIPRFLEFLMNSDKLKFSCILTEFWPILIAPKIRMIRSLGLPESSGSPGRQVAQVMKDAEQGAIRMREEVGSRDGGRAQIRARTSPDQFLQKFAIFLKEL